jgi:hypothetical protein
MENFLVSIDGKTGLRNYDEPCNYPPTGGGFNGFYGISTKSLIKMKNVVRLLMKGFEYGLPAYFMTLTFPDNYCDSERVDFKNLFLNNLKHYGKYFWVTELHESGAIHFHVLLVSERKIKKGLWLRFSKRYCKSPNGLHVRKLSTKVYDKKAKVLRTYPLSVVVYYVTKYVTKTELKKPFQLWGYTRGVTKFLVHDDILKCSPFSLIEFPESIRINKNLARLYLTNLYFEKDVSIFLEDSQISLTFVPFNFYKGRIQVLTQMMEEPEICSLNENETENYFNELFKNF